MNKKLFFLLALLSGSALQAQFQNFTQTFDSVMMHVSRADATTGILYDRVIPFAGVPRFSQWASQKDTANADRFLLAYNEHFTPVL
ncbi:MAG: hypothetical protein LBU51_01555 [Bacteroidales bacterium]|jgi:hypothetical protein|nr:hypothetical protein [Bacteroidales bacterium]